MKSLTVIILLSISVTVQFNSVCASSRHLGHPKVAHDDDDQHEDHDDEKGTPHLKDLSPWELHMLSDLYIELSLLRCPSINRLAARNLKTFIAKRLASVSGDNNQGEMMDAQFLTAYQNLVRCLDHLDTHVPHKNGKSRDAEIVDSQTEKKHKENQLKMKQFASKKLLQTPAVASVDTASGTEIVDEEGHSNSIRESSETMETKNKNIHGHPKPPPSSSSSHPARHSSFLSQTWNWIRKLFGHRHQDSKGQRTGAVVPLPDVSPVRPKRETEEGEKLPKPSKEHIKKQTDLAHKDFVLMLDMLSGIVINTCPTELRPDLSFTAKSVKDISRAVANDGPRMIGAVKNYFVRHGLWEQVRACTIETSNDKKAPANNNDKKTENIVSLRNP